MNTNQNIEIIQIFYNDPTKVFSINEISKLLSKPYGTTYKYVNYLIGEGILKSFIKGRANLCSLNFKSQKAIDLLSTISVLKKETFSKKESVLSIALDELIEKIKEKSNYNILSLILFGSIVKGRAREKSDIDLFFISAAKDKYDEMTENECNALGMSYARDVNPIIAEPNMYINMLREKGENMGKQILKDKIIYYGANKYWELTMEAMGEKG